MVAAREDDGGDRWDEPCIMLCRLRRWRRRQSQRVQVVYAR